MTKAFDRWRSKEGLSHRALCQAMDELERGLVDANLGGGFTRNGWAAPAVARAVDIEH